MMVGVRSGEREKKLLTFGTCINTSKRKGRAKKYIHNIFSKGILYISHVCICTHTYVCIYIYIYSYVPSVYIKIVP